MDNLSTLFIVATGIAVTAILGVLFDWIIKQFLPERLSSRHVSIVGFAMFLLICVASLAAIYSPSKPTNPAMSDFLTPTDKNILPETFTPTVTIFTVLPTPSETLIPSPTPTTSDTATPYIPTPSFFPNEITDDHGVFMRLIPAANFIMGSTSGGANEKPSRERYLDNYYLDVYEVTNELYLACVDVGVCNPPALKGSFLRDGLYYSNPSYSNYPVIYVDWKMAKTYCEWRGASLPTEAEWEKAARGRDAYYYPWGNDYVYCNGNISCGQGDTAEAGSYSQDLSKYGIYDMAGNVQEWVADWYSETYYQISPLSNPPGPESGEFRVLRGSAWNLDDYSARTSFRLAENPNSTYHYVGFRCARSNP